MLGIGQVLAGGILFMLFFLLLMPLKKRKEQADYANTHIKNLKVLIKSAKTKMAREFKEFEANPPKLTQLNKSILANRIRSMPVVKQQRIIAELGAVLKEIKDQQLKAVACEQAIDTRYEPAKSVMREATSKSGVDTAFTSTQALLKSDIDCVKEAIESTAQLEEDFHERWHNVLR